MLVDLQRFKVDRDFVEMRIECHLLACLNLGNEAGDDRIYQIISCRLSDLIELTLCNLHELEAVLRFLILEFPLMFFKHLARSHELLEPAHVHGTLHDLGLGERAET